MTEAIDVTKDIFYGRESNKSLPIYKCVCGEFFDDWDFTIHDRDFYFAKCPKCGVKLFFTKEVRVYKVVEE